MRDDQAFNIRFVSLVEAHPCLYDNTREDYNLSHVQDRAWAEIANQMNASAADCKGRWKNLRGSYTKHLKKYATSGSLSSNLRPYYLAKHLQFLNPFTKSRSSKVPPTYEQLASHHNEDYAELGRHITDESNEKDDWEAVDQAYDEEQLSGTETYQNSPQNLVETVYVEEPSAKFSKKRKNENSSFHLTEHKLTKQSKAEQSGNFALEAANNNKSAFECFENKKEIPQPPALTADDDADVHFLFSLLPDLRKMTDRQKRRYKMEILKIGGQILEET